MACELLTMVVTVVLMLLASAPAFAAPSELVITEFLASNDAGLQDVDGDFSDWLELHNSGADPVNLAGLSLTDDATEPTKWTFPVVDLAPDAYLVVFASDKDGDVDPAIEIHTNFRLSAGGEYLGLYDLNGMTVISEFSPEYPPQSADRSYGIDSNNAASFFSTPSPGAVNGVGDVPVAEGATADVDRGFYSSSFSVVLSTTQPSGEIRYTTDGSEPTATSGTLYSAPIVVSTTLVLRAVSFADNFLPSPTSTYTYIFLEDVIAQPAEIPGFPSGLNLPTENGSEVPIDTQMDPDVVAENAGEIMDAMTAIPTLAVSSSLENMFGDEGFYFAGDDDKDNEAVCSIEILDFNNPSENEQIDAGVEAHSRVRVKRSLRLNFRAEYGNREWRTDFFQRYIPLNHATVTNTHRTLILRAGNNRSWAGVTSDKVTYAVDEFYRSSYVAMTGVGSHGTFVHLYLNGVYWGLYNIVERPDHKFQAEYFGGDDNDYFYTNHGGAGDADRTRWDYLRNELVEKDMNDPVIYAELQQYLNVERFCDYIILGFYVGMTDWPSNNWYVANRNNASPLGPTPAVFFAWDGEFSLDRKRREPIEHFQKWPDGANIPIDFLYNAGRRNNIFQIWYSVFQTTAFRALFDERVVFHTSAGGALGTEAAIQRWDTLNAYIESAVIGESARWGDALETRGIDTRTRDNEWRTAVESIRDLLLGNTQQFLDVYADFASPKLTARILTTLLKIGEAPVEKVRDVLREFFKKF